MTTSSKEPSRSFRTVAWQFSRAMETYRFEIELDASDLTEKLILSHYDAGQFYEPDISRLMLQVLRKGDAVFDVGANCGYFTLLAATLVGPSGKVIAIEPAPACIERLEANIRRNALSNVVVLDRVAAANEGDVKFFFNSDNSGGHALWNPGDWPTNEKSRANPLAVNKLATTLDAESKRLGLPVPKLVKIDTEGAEQAVLEGAKNLLERTKVPFIAAELHEFGMAKLGFSQESLRRHMESFGYSTFGLSFSGALPRLVPAHTRIHSPFLINVLFSTPQAVGEYWPVANLDPRIG
jgi:FkbM family methyltransferase